MLPWKFGLGQCGRKYCLGIGLQWWMEARPVRVLGEPISPACENPSKANVFPVWSCWCQCHSNASGRDTTFGLRSLNEFESLQYLSPWLGYAAFNARDCCAHEIQFVTSLRSGLRPLRTSFAPSDVSQKG